MNRALPAASVVLLCGATMAAQQQPPQQRPVFRAGTQVVQVDVRVFDKTGRFVTGLGPDDFEIREDGAAQPIVSIALVGAPSLASSIPVPSAAATPATPSTAAALPAPSSTWLFLFDTIHLSPAGLTHSRGAVLDFVKQRMHQGDLAGVIADGKMINNRLTTDREELAKAVDSIRLPGEVANIQREMKSEVPRFADENEAYRIAELEDETALGQAIRRGCEDDPLLCPSMRELVRSKARAINQTLHQGSVLTLLTLRTLAHGLARMPGPKAIVYASEGFMLWNVQAELKDAIGEANRAGAHVYAIDARGLNKGHNSEILTATFMDDPGAGPSFDEKVDGPNSLAIDTGGMFIQNENDIGRALDTIQQDAGTYYVLGYTPSNQTFDGKFRSISVIAKRAGLKVRARRGYLALDPAQMLTPIAIVTRATAPAADSRAGQPGAVAPGPEMAPAPAAPATSADAIRTRIDNGKLVAALRGNETEAVTDPASLGWAAYQKGDVESAKRQLTIAAADPAAHPWVQYVLGLCHLALNEYPDAAVSWTRVRDAAPAFEPVYFNLADAYLLQNKEADAVRVLDAAAARWPKDAEIFNAIGVLQLRVHAFPAAKDAFEHAIRLAPKESLGYYNLASAYHRLYLDLQKAMPSPRQFEASARARDMAIATYRKVVALHHEYVEEATGAIDVLQKPKKKKSKTRSELAAA